MVLDNLPVYFRVHGVSLGAIGALSLLRTPWWAKVFWSPLVDQVGARRQWIRGALIAMAAALLVVATLPAAPVGLPLVIALFAFTTAAAARVGALARCLGEPAGRHSGLSVCPPLQARHERARPDGEAVLGRPGPVARRDRLHLDDARRRRERRRRARRRRAHVALGDL